MYFTKHYLSMSKKVFHAEHKDEVPQRDTMLYGNSPELGFATLFRVQNYQDLGDRYKFEVYPVDPLTSIALYHNSIMRVVQALPEEVRLLEREAYLYGYMPLELIEHFYQELVAYTSELSDRLSRDYRLMGPCQ